MPGQTRTSQAVIISLLLSVTSCASWRHKDAAPEEPPQAAPAGTPQSQGLAGQDPQQQRVDILTSNLARAQARIEELEAKMAAMHDSLEGTRITVENLTGPQGTNTRVTPVGELADNVAVPETNEAKPAQKTAKKHAPHKEPMVSATVTEAASAEDYERNSAAITTFTKAVNLMRKGGYADAELAFTQFVERYPEHALAGSAQFHAGECYFQMGECKLAIAEYEKMLTGFGNHPRVPSALVRLSHCYNAIGNTVEGSKYMELARSNFAGNPSLDWPAPAAKAAHRVATKEEPAHQQKTAASTLEAAPMEMTSEHEEPAH